MTVSNCFSRRANCWRLNLILAVLGSAYGFQVKRPSNGAPPPPLPPSTNPLMSTPALVFDAVPEAVSETLHRFSDLKHELIHNAIVSRHKKGPDVLDHATSHLASWVLATMDALEGRTPKVSEPQNKLYHLPTNDLIDILLRDIHEKNSLVTADFTQTIYEDFCLYKDGSGLDGAYPMKPWILGCKMLFEGSKSRARLIKETLMVSAHKITYRFESDLIFRGPFSPQVLLSGWVVMTRNPTTGLICAYQEVWDKSVYDIVMEAKLKLPAIAEQVVNTLSERLLFVDDVVKSILLKLLL